MFDVEITINGKSATEANIRNELEKAVLDPMIDGIKETITSTITPTEARQITVDLIAASFDNISCQVSGPDEIVKKVEAALAD